MKHCVLILSIFTVFFECNSIAQEITIPAESYAFDKIVEWKGKGAILFNRDPTGNTRKVYMTHVNSQPTTVWNQSFNPKGENYYMIYGENTRYVYFLDNLELEDNKYFYNQLNEAGTVKSGSSSLLVLFKKLGDFLPEDSELQDVVVTDKSLIHIFRHYNKKDKKYTQLAIFMTHNNFLLYGVVIGEKTAADLENVNIGGWKYVGYDGDEVLFAARDVQSKKRGYAIQRYTSKAVLKETGFIESPENDFIQLENIGFGLTGGNYLDKKNTVESSILRSINGKLYMSGIEHSGSESILSMWMYESGKWSKVRSNKLGGVSKKTIKIGVNALNEGLGFHIIDSSGDRLIFLPFDAQSPVNELPFNQNSIYNPGRLLIQERKEDFALILPDGKLFFNLEQLGKAGEVKFEFEKK